MNEKNYVRIIACMGKPGEKIGKPTKGRYCLGTKEKNGS